jgi:hypothetical protein
MLACEFSHLEVVKWLIDKVDMTLEEFKKIKTIAQKNKHNEIVKILQAKINKPHNKTQ